MVWVKIVRLDKSQELPKYATEDSVAVDLYSRENLEILPGETKLAPSGIKISIPSGYEIQIRPRSGLALKNGITVLNTPGTIDSDYRGEVGIILHNSSKQAFKVNKGDRVAQAVLNKVELIRWREVEELDETQRGLGGFGSTGISQEAKPKK
jgi:dUTP pyrophosphatase